MGSLIGSDGGPSDWRRSVLRRKPISPATQGADAGARPLERSIGLFRLVMLGVGATVGTGIFVILSAAVPEAGPAILVSFLLAAVTAGLTALCYAELASALPLSGSSYSYAYATLGELAAFLVGACLLLEYAVSASAIAVGWGQYLNEVLSALLGWTMPDSISQPPGRGGYVNLPAIVLIGLCTLLLLRGTAESTAINAVLVVLKLAVLVFFAVVALTAFEPANLTPFAPLGWAGIGTAASTIFFSYIGLDTISTASEEVRDPARTLPLGILLSLVIVTAIYLLVALAGIGAQPWTHFAGQDAGLAVILRNVTGTPWPALVLSIGAVISIFSVTLVTMYGQTRILFAMSRDGLLPTLFQRVDRRSRSPNANTLVVGFFVASLAALVPLDVLANLTSMGTLVAFTAVSLSVIILRRRRPDLPRGFRVPLYPLVPLASLACCLMLIAALPRDTYLLFAIWIGVALVIYTAYSQRHSRLARG
ncbi:MULTISPECIES: amino acid permease [unclassified Methylobacterium]|uniref:amino acid permease n=1 Tax=unclassified Methylobacterium TaxID=2615210 RepID=UPI0006FFAB68|nr:MULTISPECIES: amino acid permease [unclassified Methylobacterium]KQO52052.1 amino acid permease [Methylobacterium sp. Leaf86]KQO90439.1 amino acid permease [Methylobacterium sp. Leaf91]